MKKLYIDYNKEYGIYAKVTDENGKVLKYADTEKNKSFSQLMEVIQKHLRKGYTIVGDNIFVSDIKISINKSLWYEIDKGYLNIGKYSSKKQKANRNKTIAGVTFLSALLALEMFITSNTKSLKTDEPVIEPVQVEEVVVTEPEKEVEKPKVYTIFKSIEGTEEMYADFDRCQSEYGELIEKYAYQYGIDPAIITAIGATRINERDLNSADYYGQIGIMGLKYYQLHKREVRVFNYNTGMFDRFTIIAEPLSNPVPGVVYENMQDPESNIKIMCALIQIAYRDYSNNIVMALESIPQKYKDFRKVINDYSEINGLRTSFVYENKVDYSWLNHMYNSDLSRSYALKIISYIRPGTNFKMADYYLGQQVDSMGNTKNMIMPKIDYYKVDSYIKEKVM